MRNAPDSCRTWPSGPGLRTYAPCLSGRPRRQANRPQTTALRAGDQPPANPIRPPSPPVREAAQPPQAKASQPARTTPVNNHHQPTSPLFATTARPPPKQNCCDLRTTGSMALTICATLETSRRRGAKSDLPAASKPLEDRVADDPVRPSIEHARSHESSHHSPQPQRSRPRPAAQARAGEGAEGELRGLLFPPEPPLRARCRQALPDLPPRLRGAQGAAAAELRFSPGAHALGLGVSATALRLQHSHAHERVGTLKCG